jgi:alpha-amylase/alpha-mannosidase (GH57 family)
MIGATNNQVYLTIHGHFYQPPRENPWLEYIEEQESAAPFHNWNERITVECYNPNSVARITDNTSKIKDIVNNYSLISFNFGPTLLSWLKDFCPITYNKILLSDTLSMENHSGHGNAIAQVYNHIIMPLANYRDKVTQVHWGIKDFEYRFNRKPEGIWLSETAVCDETLKVLIDAGIKFTILSPFQAQKVKYAPDRDWEDVSKGNIDPARPYRYYYKNDKDQYIDLFFYDGTISKAVAFEGLLFNGDKLVDRIKDGIVPSRGYPQLVHLATDGESYGHHTPYGDRALAYGLKVRLEKEGFSLTNYGEYLEKFPPIAEAKIKNNTAWSCSHGVRRWKEDCGCSTGAHAGWNQRWRKPLREALNWLNDELADLYEKEAKRYFKDVWQARNNYIDVIFDKTTDSIEQFFNENAIKSMSENEKVSALKLLEIQKNAMYMFTSCGWFFADISGIETVQILKYAAKAMQLAFEFGRGDLETQFLNILAKAESNLKEHGNGKDIYKKFVKPSIVGLKQVIAHWAINSLYENYPDVTRVYSYTISQKDYERTNKNSSALAIGRIEVTTDSILEKNDMIFALLHFGRGDFHCVIKGFAGNTEYQRIKNDLIHKFNNESITEVIRGVDELFGREYLSLKDIFKDKKKHILQELVKGQLEEFSTLYYKIYKDSQSSIYQLTEMELPIPDEFKIAAKYTLSREFNQNVSKIEDVSDIDYFHEIIKINKEAHKLGIKLNKKPSAELFTLKINEAMKTFASDKCIDQIKRIVHILEVAKDLELEINLTNAQNIYFDNLNNGLSEMINNLPKSLTYEEDKEFLSEVLNLGENLNFNLDRYYHLLSKKLVVPNKEKATKV